MYENKENMDKVPVQNADICSHWTTVERHFMPSVRAFAGSGTLFRAMMDLRARRCESARRSRFARRIRPCRPGVGEKAETGGSFTATHGP